MIQDAFNSTQTPTMANFATLANVDGRLRRAGEGRCMQPVSLPPRPGGTARRRRTRSTAALSIAHNAGYKPERVFALLDAFYPVPQGKNCARLRSCPI